MNRSQRDNATLSTVLHFVTYVALMELLIASNMSEYLSRSCNAKRKLGIILQVKPHPKVLTVACCYAHRKQYLQSTEPCHAVL